MGMAPPHAMFLIPAHKAILVELLPLRSVARHPMHRHDGKGVLRSTAKPRGTEDFVNARSHQLVHVQLDTHSDELAKHLNSYL